MRHSIFFCANDKLSKMSNIKVCVKIRPLSERDIKLRKEEEWKVTDDDKSLQCVNILHPCDFTFDHIFGTKCLNYDVYSSFLKPIVDSCLIGFNGTILAYGPTSAGKNYTMIGTDMNPGIILITIERLFKTSGFFQRQIRFGYIEIYKEKIYDLLSDRKLVLIDRHQSDDITLSNDEVVVNNFENAEKILFNGSYKRRSAAEDGSKLSSMSHSILRITIESEDKTNGKMQTSHLRFVHVAGCEPMTEFPLPDSLEDDSNKSLYWFNVVIDRLSKGEKDVNFDNSVLTTLLRESLTGKSNTAIVCNIRADELAETTSTLEFVSRAKNIRTWPMRNEIHKVQERFSTLDKKSPTSSTPVDSKITFQMENQLKEIAKIKVENLLLRKELEEVKAAFAAKTTWFEEQMKSAEFAQQKLEHAQIEDKSSFQRIQNGLQAKIKKLTNSNEYLLGRVELLQKTAPAHSLPKSSDVPIFTQNDDVTLPRNNMEKQQQRKTDDKTGIKRKIERLESDLSKNIKMLKDELHHGKKAAVKPTSSERITPLMTTDETESHTTTVPNYLIGRVIGPKGVKLKSLKSTTGARVSISERNGDTDRTVTIMGNKSSVCMAVDMIQDMLKYND